MSLDENEFDPEDVFSENADESASAEDKPRKPKKRRNKLIEDNEMVIIKPHVKKHTLDVKGANTLNGKNRGAAVQKVPLINQEVASPKDTLSTLIVPNVAPQMDAQSAQDRKNRGDNRTVNIPNAPHTNITINSNVNGAPPTQPSLIERAPPLPITPQRNSSNTRGLPKEPVSVNVQIPIKKIFEQIKDNNDFKDSAYKLEHNHPKGRLIPNPGDPVEIEEKSNHSSVCTFKGSKEMDKTAKILLDGFLASGQTDLTIGGADSKMVLILAKLVSEEKSKNPTLEVHLTREATTTLSSTPEGLILINKLVPPQAAPTTPRRS